ncbi:MAG: hypothetical protein AAF340_04900 [Pseudomonadota bacterium]
MSGFRASVLAALLAFTPVSAFSDVTALAIRAPLSEIEQPLPVMPNTPVGFRIQAHAPLPSDAGGLKHIIAPQKNISAFGIACGESLHVTAQPEAILHVEVSAPCRPHSKVEITHAGLSFGDTLSYAGTLTFEMPAMEPSGEVLVRFGQEQSLNGIATVGDLSEFTRLAIAWEAGTAMSLRAQAPSHLPVTTYQIGTDKRFQVLSYHQDPQHSAGVIRLSLARPIHSETCDRGAEGDVLKLTPDLPPLRYQLKLAAPGCARIGEMFLLKNVLQDLKLVGR